MTPNMIVIHCSESPQGRGDSAKDIHTWHQQRGFDGVGYHYIIDEYGTLENGRPDYWQGSHAKEVNSHSLGICLIGIDSFTEAQYDTLATLVWNKCNEYNIKFDKVVGHCDVTDSGKTCPNFNVRKFVNERIIDEQ